MNQVLQTYLNSAFRYVFTQGPDVATSQEQALEDGINCISLSHLVLRDLFGYTLPSNLKSLELSTDRIHFQSVDTFEAMQLGDLVWFGPADSAVMLNDFVPNYKDGELLNWKDFPIKHVAIYTGEKSDGDYLMLHATSVEGTNVVWPLRRFSDYDNYKKVYFIKRLKAEFRQTN